MELKLENVRKEVSRVWHIRRDMKLSAGIEELFAARHHRSDALILQPQGPPCLVVVRRRDFSGKDLPAPLIDEQAERKKRDLVERSRQQKADIARRIGCFVEQPNFYKILRCDRQR